MQAARSDNTLKLHEPGRVGLLAGGGRFPILFAEGARRQGHYVHGVGVLGMAPEELVEVCDSFEWTPIAKIGRAIRSFVRHDVRHVIMAGKIEKTVLFQPQRLWVAAHADWSQEDLPHGELNAPLTNCARTTVG